MPRSRRTVLRNGLVLGVLGVSGCLERLVAPPTETAQIDDEMPTEITLRLDEAHLPESKRASIDPVVFSELPDGEPKIVQTAMAEEEYTEQIGEDSGAFSTVRRTIEAPASEDLRVYLRADDTYYSVGPVEGDHIIAET